MSLALLEESNLDTLLENEKREVLAQRSHILETASRKAQERTLTLQETTDLYAEFNRTYEKNFKNRIKKEDESWALKLLKDCEEESARDILESKINGERIAQKNTPKPSINFPETHPNEHLVDKKPAVNNHYSLVTDEEKTTIRDLFIYDQFYSDETNSSGSRSHKPFLVVMSLSVAITLSGLIGIAIFL